VSILAQVASGLAGSLTTFALAALTRCIQRRKQQAQAQDAARLTAAAIQRGRTKL
jgi:hypothetical protein